MPDTGQGRSPPPVLPVLPGKTAGRSYYTLSPVSRGPGPDVHLDIHLQGPYLYLYPAARRGIFHCVFQDISHSFRSPFGVMHRRTGSKGFCLQADLFFSGLSIDSADTFGNSLFQGAGLLSKVRIPCSSREAFTRFFISHWIFSACSWFRSRNISCSFFVSFSSLRISVFIKILARGVFS